MGLLADLRGKVCCCEFNLPSNEWPFPGWPAWVVVLDVDSGLIKMDYEWGNKPVWVAASTIKTIRPEREAQTP